MSHKPEDVSDLYRQFRSHNSKERDTSDAVECFTKHLGDEQSYQARVEHIVAAIPDTHGAHANTQHNYLVAVKHWCEQFITRWFARLTSKWGSTPALSFAVLGLCGLLVVGLLVNQKPYPWGSLVPNSVIEAGLTPSQLDAMSGSTQMGFTPSGHELTAQYALGKISTQLALSMALDDDSRLPYFVASFQSLALAGLSPEVSRQVEALSVHLSAQPTGQKIGQTLTELMQTVNEQSLDKLNGFVLGQHMESLSLALDIAESQDNRLALKDVSADLAELRIDQWQSTELPKLNAILVQIHGLLQGDMSLSQRRHLTQLIQQLDVLLA